MRILAVCIGNIARSPAAAAAIRREAERAGLEVAVDSAGVAARDGQVPSRRMQELAARRGLDIDHRARQVHRSDVTWADLVVAMDRFTHDRLAELAPEAAHKIELFAHYDPEHRSDDVLDPGGGSDEEFEAALDIIERAAVSLVDGLSEKDRDVTPPVAD